MVGTVGSRVNSRKTPIIVVKQRLHEEDTTGFLLSGKTGEKWDQLSLPALIENEDGTSTALWTHKHTVEELLNMRASMPYWFSGQMQQTPTPPAGETINITWFPRYEQQPVSFEQIMFSCDTAIEDKQINDPSVIAVFG